MDIGIDGVLHFLRVGNAFDVQHLLDLVAHAAFVLEQQAQVRPQRQTTLAPVCDGPRAQLAALPLVAAQRQQVVRHDVITNLAHVCSSASARFRLALPGFSMNTQRLPWRLQCSLTRQ
jgi:hypothetical protein